MPLYFAHPPRAAAGTPNVISIGSKEFVATEPSRFKVYPQQLANSAYSFLWRMIAPLFMIVFSFGVGAYIPTVTPGGVPKTPETSLPFVLPGLAFHLRKGASEIPQLIKSELLSRGFTEVEFQRRQVYLKKDATSDDYVYVSENIDGLSETSAVPLRYLNPEAFKSVLIVLALTTNICQGMQFATGYGEKVEVDKKEEISRMKVGENVREADEDEFVAVQESHLPFQNDKYTAPKLSQWESMIDRMYRHNGFGAGGQGAVVSRWGNTVEGFITTGDVTKLTHHGILCAFNSAICSPDPNLIADVIGRYFMAMLGSTHEEQAETLSTLKSGLSLLRLSLLGDELAHLYRCIEIAIECQAGCVPYFTGSVYEGTAIMGGNGAILHTLYGSISFSPVADLRTEFLDASAHVTALKAISAFFPEAARPGVMGRKSMGGLRTMCRTNAFKADDHEKIIGLARSLNFGEQHWQVNPVNLKKAFSVMSGATPLTEDLPISPAVLFDSDMVAVALSLFGETSAPSWNIPGGAINSFAGAPPKPTPTGPKKGKGKEKEPIVLDNKWHMEIRRVKLSVAVEDFKALKAIKGYRSVVAAAARKQGYFVLDGGRMSVFWDEMKTALGIVTVGDEEGDAEASKGKRKAAEEDLEKVCPRPIGLVTERVSNNRAAKGTEGQEIGVCQRKEEGSAGRGVVRVLFFLMGLVSFSGYSGSSLPLFSYFG